MYVIGHNCKAKHGGQCVFPFIYNGITYFGCTLEGNDQPWCSTEVDSDGNHVDGKWVNCDNCNKLNKVVFTGQVSKGNQLPEILRNWGHQYTVEFQITVRNNPPSWMSVFHLTIGNSNGAFGDRIPALYMNPNGYFHFTSAVSEEVNHEFDYYYELNKAYHIKIIQTSSGTYCIQINKVNVHCLKNNSPRTFEEVFIYVSNPWSDPFDSSYGELNYLNISDAGKHINPEYNSNH